MASLTDSEQAFLDAVNAAFDDYLRNGLTHGSTQSIIPMYKYRDSALDGNMLPALDPSYPPFDTINPSLRDGVKSTSLGLAMAIAKAAARTKNTNPCVLLNGSDVWISFDPVVPPPLVANTYFDGTIEITGNFMVRLGGVINPVARLPAGVSPPTGKISFTAIANNTPIAMELLTNGDINFGSGAAPTLGNFCFIHLRFTP